MKILGIETSCDDTGIAIIEAMGRKNPSFRILANIVASQIKVHQQYGGVYPTMAKREHETNLPIAITQALKKAKITPRGLDALAITYGPGLSPCLWTGLNKAQELAEKWNVPLIPINHMEGHLLISLFSQRNSISNFQFPIFKRTFPAIALLVSGGHTQLILVTALGKYKLLGETRDDAAGECFDKTARILGLPYPGGPAIAKLASSKLSSVKFAPNLTELSLAELSLPRPMMRTKDYDFSFSGLKTAVLYDWKSRSKKVRESAWYVREMAREIQSAIVEVLVAKTLRAAQRNSAKTVILGGGVGANTMLRSTLSKEADLMGMKFLAAPKELCTDNGAMIAVAGYATWLRQGFKNRKHIEANPNLAL
jgi:N6-L-threonylcarbamoyladenine synthase